MSCMDATVPSKPALEMLGKCQGSHLRSGRQKHSLCLSLQVPTVGSARNHRAAALSYSAVLYHAIRWCFGGTTFNVIVKGGHLACPWPRAAPARPRLGESEAELHDQDPEVPPERGLTRIIRSRIHCSLHISASESVKEMCQLVGRR